MSSATRTGSIAATAWWLRTQSWRYGFALAGVCIAVAVQRVLEIETGFPHSFLMFYPTILIVSLLAGFLPGVTATLLSGLAALYLYRSPMNSLVVSDETAKVGLTLFMVVGITISWLANLVRERANRLQEFEKVVEGLEEMIVVVDRNYRYLIANRSFLNYRGMKRENLIGCRIPEILNPGAFEATIKEKLDECFRGRIVQFEMRYQSPNRGERELVIVHFPIKGRHGVDRVASVLRDVTEQKQSDHSLRLFRALIDQSNDAVEVIDPETLRFLDVNDKACTDLGYTREELLGMTAFDIDPSGHRSSQTAFLEKVRAEGYVVGESIHRRKDGSTFPVEVSIKCVQLDRSYLVTVARDITDRKRSEAALHESEDRCRDLVEHSEDLVCTHDLSGKLLSVNPAPARVLGYEVGELLQMPMRELIAPDFREQFDLYLERIRTKGADHGLLCVLTRSGERRIWEYRNTVRTEGVPEPIVRGMAHDVTERKKAESAVIASEQRYRLLFEKNIAGVAIASLDGQLLDCNDAWARILGYDSAREIQGRYASEFYFDLNERKSLREQLEHTGAFHAQEIQLRRKDGSGVWVLFDCAVLPSEGGQPIVQSTAIDITERKQAEEALRDSELRYRTLFEKAIAAVGIITMGGTVLDCNDAWARMFGHTSTAECRGDQIQNCYRDPAQRESLLAELCQSGVFVNREWELRRKDGAPFWALLSSVLIPQPDGEPLIQSTMFDITERKHAEDALRRSEESYRNFVARSSEGIFRQDVDAPIPIDLPEDELVRHILHDSYLAECNDAIVKMYGLNSVQDFLGRRFIEFVDPNDPLNLELTRQYIRSGFRVVDRESYETDIQGNRKVFRNSMIGIVEDDKLVRTWGIRRDVTEQVKLEHARHEAEQALRKSEERFRVALKDSPITVFNQDRDLRYTWIYNPQLYWQRDALGKTDDELLGPKKASVLDDLKRRVLASGVGAREEVAIPQNGTSHVFDITIEPLFDAQKGVVGITAACMDIARLREMADRLQESRDRLANTKSYLESEIQTELGFEKIIGQSPALREVLKKARVVAPTDSTVLLLGETGTGKELVARSVHALSARCDNTFVKLNCAAVPSGLLESELFGHEKGAFTGAVNQKIGRIELADKGTLFLDEIGEMPPELQPKLLRVLQDREFERLGGIRTLHVDVRIISATNRDLHQDVADKKFREDLFYRLNVFPIELPPLRDRRDDIPMLVQHFVRKHAVRMGKGIDTIPDDAMRVLRSWNWPGNVRELENVIERMVIMTKGSILSAPPAELSEAEYTAEDNLTEMERDHILRVLRDTGGVLSGNDGAASRLGLKRTTLQSMIKRLGIHPGEYRSSSTGTFGRP